MQTPEDDTTTAAPPSAAQAPSEPLACSSCRSRKLKCDRLKPACTRCAKVKNDCVYPESRRKPAFKRRNVRELETRLAKLEGLLKDVSPIGVPVEGTADTAGNVADSIPNVESQGSSSSSTVPERGTMFCGGDFDLNETYLTNLMNGEMPPGNPLPHATPFSMPCDDVPTSFDSFSSTTGLIGLGQFEALPPFEMIEELHRTFFERQAHFVPLIHQGRYLQAFHSAPHMRPPMCLQYAIWTMAANGHEKYSDYHDIFYQRTRHYLEVDELKGYGEHFLTIHHLQAWALTATAEARRMFFTRAGMSSAKCVKLIHMMGLHRLDDDSDEGQLMSPTLSPPQNWVELEERRRCLWGVFCIDSHASISTGWPNLIDMSEVTTRLPSTEDAFNSGREDVAPTLDESIKGAEYSTFGGAVLICHIFNQILKHIHRPTPNDRPDDVNHGPFWMRHRELDNTLSSIFMFLPERFRLPKNIRDPVALHTNLNLHASIICLHNAASDKADKLGLPSNMKKMSQERALTAAQEITNIMKLSSHITTTYRSPLVSLSLYCAVSTYIHQAKNNQGVCDVGSLEFVINCMVVISREHVITRAYLQQSLLDIERNGVVTSLNIPQVKIVNKGTCAHNIPLLARSSISNHTEIQPPLPGRLPLGRPQGTMHVPREKWHCPDLSTTAPSTVPDPPTAPGAKRKRKSPGPALATSAAKAPAGYRVAAVSSSSSSSSTTTTATSSSAAASSSRQPTFGAAFAAGRAGLPHRTGSPSSSSSLSAAAVAAGVQSPLLSRMSVHATGMGLPTMAPSNLAAATAAAAAPGMPATTQPAAADFNLLHMFQEIDDRWDLADLGNLGTMYDHVSELVQKGPSDFEDDSGAPWTWDAGG